MKDKSDQRPQALWERLLPAWVPVVVVLLSVAGSLFTWHNNAAAERAHQDYVRREQRYAALVSSLQGFHVAGSSEDRAKFLEQLNLCWLYCSDPVIRAAYHFLGTVQAGAASNEGDRQQAMGELVGAITRDLLSRQPVGETSLSPTEFKILKPQ